MSSYLHFQMKLEGLRMNLRDIRKTITPERGPSEVNSIWDTETGRVTLLWRLRNHTICYEKKGPNAPMGPFGGGWKWNIGVRRGQSSWYIMLKTVSITINKRVERAI